MSDEEISPIARALFGGSDAPDREVPCLRCGAPTMCPGFIWESVRLWNRDEFALAEAARRAADMIRANEITACDSCAPTVREERRAEYIKECTTTDVYLRELRAGKYNPDSLRWLRAHGWGHEVHRVLSEEGNRNA